eukprot:CAMPEP_0168345774 /NCGR_PEP_ID=MMETSP0213-20121227/17793_1 /TAXON_ID=151035 /ORGANISM="Euplotes harpa, Strain FSP1.4" /LENGTH=93 /DNA_ID=CAMNT_0008354133 /DNA_START=525 /DNA_END=806 /DNA_ORIENTATION=-
MTKSSSETAEKSAFVSKRIGEACPMISVLTLEDNLDAEDTKAEELKILEKEISTDSTQEDDFTCDDLKKREYVIPPKMLMSLEMQEAALAKKL